MRREKEDKIREEFLPQRHREHGGKMKTKIVSNKSNKTRIVYGL